MRRTVVLVLSLVFLLPPFAEAAPQIKGTPQQTLTRLIQAFQRRDHGAEWDTLSPGFKLRLSRRAGRNVDVGDYITARTTHRRDPRVRELRQWMHTAHITHIDYDGRGYARVTIRFGAPLLLGKDVTVRMVNHELWQLWIKGEKQPYWGFTTNKQIQVFRDPKTGVHTVITRNPKGKITWRKDFPQEKVQGYRTLTQWYFHDFGNFEKEFMKKVR